MEGCYRKLVRYSLLALVFLLIFGCRSGKQEHSNPEYGLSVKELSSLQSGDIIFRMGYGALSASIVSLFNDTLKLSHCGIVIRDSIGLSVIHTISPSISNVDGMQQCTIQEFVDDSRKNSIAIVRFRYGNGQRIAQKAAYYLDKQVPFDIYFDLVDTSAFFCSELPIQILKDEFDFDALQGKPPITQNCKFSIFFDPQYFELVANHLSR